MLPDTILAIDQGTTNSKAVLLDQQGHIVAFGASPLEISHPKPGWVEQSPDAIWHSVLTAIKACLAQAPDVHIVAIGISNQRESVVQWDAATGEPLGPAITWQCRRTTPDTEALRAAGHGERVLSRTGLPLDPLFPATKLRWLLDLGNVASRHLGTVDSWLLWKLTDGRCFATDRSNASRTQLLNVQTGEWDPELCDLFGVPETVLPIVQNSKHPFGHTRKVPGLPDGIAVCSAMGDSHAALFGHAAFAPGESKATFGTGSSVMMVCPQFSVPGDGMTTTIAWSMDGDITYALEGNILVSASLFPWVATLLGLQGDVEELMALAESVDHSNGAVLIPALVGLGAPHWQPEARGLLSGLSFASSPAHVAHAAALSMPLQVVDVFEAMCRQSSATPGRIYVDGGPTRNRFLMQMLANLLSQPVSISQDPELSALGAGMLAGLEVGFWSGLEDIASLERNRTTLQPDMPEARRNQIRTMWQMGLEQCLHADKRQPPD